MLSFGDRFRAGDRIRRGEIDQNRNGVRFCQDFRVLGPKEARTACNDGNAVFYTKQLVD
jgi:hypothetical protein